MGGGRWQAGVDAAGRVGRGGFFGSAAACHQPQPPRRLSSPSPLSAACWSSSAFRCWQQSAVMSTRWWAGSGVAFWFQVFLLVISSEPFNKRVAWLPCAAPGVVAPPGRCTFVRLLNAPTTRCTLVRTSRPSAPLARSRALTATPALSRYIFTLPPPTPALSALPQVFGGGPVLTANPEPFANFFDMVLLGGRRVHPSCAACMQPARRERRVCASSVAGQGWWAISAWLQARHHPALLPPSSILV